jgi:hypothetical protein
MTLSHFAKSYLHLQGVELIKPRVKSKPVGVRQGESVVKVDLYERGDA